MPSSQSQKSEGRRPGRPSGEESGVGRSALLTAAREILAEKGLARLTSKAVGERAGLKPTLINYYFGGRRGLLRALVAETSDELTARILEASTHDGSVEERLARMMGLILRGYVEEPYAARLFFEQVIFAEDEAIDSFVERSGNSAIGALRKVLEDGYEEGRFQDIDPEIALAAIGGICIFFGAATPLLQKILDMDPMTTENVDGVARRVSDLLLNGLAVKEGRGE